MWPLTPQSLIQRLAREKYTLKTRASDNSALPSYDSDLAVVEGGGVQFFFSNIKDLLLAKFI